MSWPWFLSALKGIFREREISVTERIQWTGYQNMKNLPRLLSACYEGINNVEFRPTQDGRTFCNEFVNSVAVWMGYQDFEKMLANAMIDHMSSSPDWSVTPLEKAQFLANTGSLLIAGLKDEPHGHVCVIAPGLETRSIHWSMSVPVCANVGKDVFIGKGLSWAFRQVPMIYAWRQSL